jgi:hypothetical protein
MKLCASAKNVMGLVSARKTVKVLSVSFGLLLFCIPVFSQLNYGRIFGGITDQTGGAIAGATVTIIDVDRGLPRPLVTDSAGEYNAPSLLAGTYTIRVEAKGFQTVERQNVVLGVGGNARVDVTMVPGEQTQTVTVTESVPLLNTADAQLSGNVESAQLDNLPITGHQYYHALDFVPGITVQPGGFTTSMVSAGGRQHDLGWVFDGLDETETWAGAGPLAGMGEVSILPIDSIDQVKVVQNPNAEYGWRSSAIVTVGIKSGTNALHGSAYYNLENTGLNARNAFTSASGPLGGRAATHVSDYGASIGGPIKKNKMFYFANYEGESFRAGEPRQVQAPTLIPNAGASGGTNPTVSIPDAIAALNAAGASLSPLSLKLSGCNPSGAGITSTNPVTVATACSAASGIFGSYPVGGSQVLGLTDFGGSKNVVGKWDYHINDHNSVNAEYFYSRGNDNTPGSIQPYWAEDSPQFTGLGRAVWVWTPNSSWVNEARFGYSGNNGPTYPSECVYNNLGQPDYAAAFGYTPGTPSNPPGCHPFAPVTIGNFTSLGSDSGGGAFQIRDWAWLDTVSYTRGKHAFKWGVEVHYETFTGAGKLTGLTGSLDFGNTAAVNLGSILAANTTPLEDFAAGVPDSGSILIGVPNLDIASERYAGFVQDSYRLIPRLTVNLGLRYEYAGPLVDAHNALGNFDPTSPTGLVQQQNGQALYHNSAKDFDPRLGLVWDVTGKGTTVVRTGMSVVNNNNTNYNDFLHTSFDSALELMPTGWNLTTASGSVLPASGNILAGVATLAATTPGALTWVENQPIYNVTNTALACGNGVGKNPSPCALYATNPNFPLGYMTTWTLDVQHAFTSNLSLDVSYIGMHGTDLTGDIDENAPSFGAKGTAAEQLRRPYTENCPSSTPGGLGLDPSECFPYFGHINYYTANLKSNYDGLVLALTERASHGLNFAAAYTLAHALDDITNIQSFIPVNNADPYSSDYGNSDVDARNHFTFTASYSIPGIKSPGQLLEGWQINTTINVLGAFPFAGVDTNSDLSGTGEKYDLWDLAGPASSFDGGGLANLPCYGVTGSTFASATTVLGTLACKTVGTVSQMPAMCVSQATNEPTNPNPSVVAGPRGTGLTALAALGCYSSGSAVITPPAQGTEGTMPRNTLRGRPYKDWDFSIQKNWTFKERFGLQFRTEFYNVINDTEYAGPASNPNNPATFGATQSSPNSGLVITGGGPRTIFMGLRATF